MEDKENKLPENQGDQQDGVQGNPELPKQAEEDSKEVENPTEEHQQEAPTAEPTESPQDTEEEEKPTTPPAETEPAEKAAEAAEEPSSDHSAEEDAGDEQEESEHDDHEDDVDEDTKLLDSLHFENPSKDELLDVLRKVAAMQNMRTLDKALKEIRPHFDQIYEKEKDEALKAFTAEEGNDEADFVYKGEEVDQKFLELYENLRFKKQRYFSELEKSKDENLARKNELLEKLRELVDGEESTASINALKELQQEWKRIGPVPGAHAKSLWANYNAILDRFYDNRSIYFELKELDRKKNLRGKLKLCERAEELDKLENIKEAIVELNELHEEFKHIGPIPKEDQEPVWQRFKAASDRIYAKRKEYFEVLKTELSENAEKKQALGDQAEGFANFTSDRITDWNKKTKELIDLQKKWESIGGLPRDKAKQTNKHFWSNFKQFFANKSAFFKTLDSQREDNLKKKQELLEQAERLKDSEEWEQAANELKRLQSEWREIGPVPEKFRNEVYHQFKAACDRFFERRRAKGSVQNKEYEQNLKKKEDICNMLEAYLNSDTIELEEIYGLLDQYAEIGFVPRNTIKKIHNRFDEVTEKLMALEDLSDDQLAELQTQVQLSKLKNSPHGSQKINRKEGAVKRKISVLEGDIATWKTNLEFFADSKTANKLKEEFEAKIEKAEAEIVDLKKQLRVLKQM